MDSDEVHSALDWASELLEAGRPKDTLQHLETVADELVEEDDFVEFYSLKAWALSELDRTEEALTLLEPAINEYPDSARLHSTLGVVLSNQGDYERACEALEEAVALDPTDEVAVANLGLVCEMLREYERAIQVYDQALHLGAEIDWLLQRKSAVHAELGNLVEARMTLSRYLSLVPDDADAWITLGAIQRDEERYDDAFESFRTAERLAPDSAPLRLNWGETAVRKGLNDIARQQLEHLIKLEPESGHPLLLEAIILEEEGDLDSALQRYTEALSKPDASDPNDVGRTIEMAMDFFTRNQMRTLCEQLIEQAYLTNMCSVEVCEAYREATGEFAGKANWYSLLVEADYRPGLLQIPAANGKLRTPITRYIRNFQVVARDHDDAIAIVTQFAGRMHEANISVREFVSEEDMADVFTGLYEVEREVLVFGAD